MISFPNSARRRGFTLIELLVVITVITILLVVAAPVFTGSVRAGKLTLAGEALARDLDAARHTATIFNTPTTFEFISGVHEDHPNEPARFLGYRYRRQLADGTFDVGEMIRIPSIVHFSEDPGMETLLSGVPASTIQSGVTDPTLGPGTFTIVPFRFYPDGSTDLPEHPSDRWFITLVHYDDAVLRGVSPSNFVSITVNATTGRILQFRP